MLAELDRLSAYGISINIPTFGSFTGIYSGISSTRPNVNYDGLSNVMGGGNVYLDGRKVGDYVTGQQTKAYKGLQRSGWRK